MKKRTLLLTSGSALVLVLLFIGYSMLVRDPGADSRRAAGPPPGQVGPTDLQGEDVLRVGPGGQVAITPGGGAEYTVYDERTGQPRYHIAYDAMRPLPGDARRIELAGPRLSMRLPRGRTATISADEGMVTFDRVDRTRAEWKYGTLAGNVRIVVQAQRREEAGKDGDAKAAQADPALGPGDGVAANVDAANGARRRKDSNFADGDPNDPDRVVILMETLTFDLELGTLKSDKPLSLVGPQFELEGVGLDLTWNQAANRVDELTIHEGRKLVLHDIGDLLSAVGMRKPAADATGDGSAGGEETESATDPAEGGRATGGTSPAAPPRAQSADRYSSYLCTLTGDVEAAQFHGEQRMAGLSASELRLLFDLGRGAGLFQQDAARRAASQPTTAAADQPDRRLVIHWSGPLHLLPTDPPAPPMQWGRPGAEPPAPPGPRRRIEALGPEVVLTRAESSIHCGRLEFYEDTSQVWLHRGESPNVRMELDDGSWATAAAIYIDRDAGIIKLAGPVRLESIRKGNPAAAQPAPRSNVRRMSIACSQMAELHLYEAEQGGAAQGAGGQGAGEDDPVADDFGGELSTLSRALKSAIFFGDVEVGMEDRKLTSHRLDMSFRRLKQEQSFESLIESAVATGGVVFTGDDDQVTAGRLQIDFGLAAGGDPYVSRLDSLGNVRMTRGDSWLRGERVVAVLDKPVRLDDAMLDRPLAAADGVRVPSALSVTVERASVPASPGQRSQIAAGDSPAEFAIRTLDVYGDAELFRPDDNVGARGEHVAVWLAGENEFQRARIVGTPDEPALVHAEPYTVRGGRIDIDGEALTLHVDGPSHLDFITRRGLQGARGKPARVDVVSQKLLHVDGRNNEIRMEGDVNVTRGSELLRGDTLTLLLEDVATPATPEPVDERRARLGRLWSGLAAMIRGDADAAGDDRGGGSGGKRRLEIAGFESERIGRKEPVRLIAENALVQTEIADPAAQPAPPADGTGGSEAGGSVPIMHRSLTAPRLVVDIPNGITTTFGQTALLVEDYRIDPAAAAAGGADGDMNTQFVPSDLVSGGPMQTAIFCEDRMTYALGDESTGSRDSVLLEGGVFLNHLTGRDIINFDENPRLTRLDPETIQKLRNRDSTLKCDRLECEFGDGATAAPAAAGAPAVTPNGNAGGNADPGRSAAATLTAAGGPAQRPPRNPRGDAVADPVSGRLTWMLASGHVVLTDKQNGVTTEVYAERISFDRKTAMVSVYGSRSVDARVYRFTADDKFSAHVGPEFHIDLARNTIRAGGMGEVRP